ncbi:hypothetical protein, partial [Vibrio celticus]|uniref:hypothetical protein n=1 Tax=Vibrio celticus TaxID=446372 RepID=UPI0019D26414
KYVDSIYGMGQRRASSKMDINVLQASGVIYLPQLPDSKTAPHESVPLVIETGQKLSPLPYVISFTLCSNS